MTDSTENKRILIVDDDPMLRNMQKLFLGRYFKVDVAADGLEALEKIRYFMPDLALIDIDMPRMDGLTLMKELNIEIPGLPIIFLSGSGDLDKIQQALSGYTSDYIMKPADNADLLLRINAALISAEKRRKDSEKAIAAATRELRDIKLEIINRLARAAELRDPETGMHILRVGYMAGELALVCGFDAKFCDLMVFAAPMHDVGKVGIPDHILLKPGKLTPEEFEVIKTHTVIGSRVLSGSRHQLIQMAETIALTHHEKWDGSGYPNGLSGIDIPVEGRITAIADVFDALTSERPYKMAWPAEKAFLEIQTQTGKQFDPDLVECFLQIEDRILKIREKFRDEDSQIVTIE